MEEIYTILSNLNIKYKRIDHEPVYTVEQANSIVQNISGIGTKNLFLKDKEGKYYLLIIEDSKRADMKLLACKLETNKIKFGSEEELMKLLGLEYGYVTPFGIVNDLENKVKILIDEELVNKLMLQAPNTNRATINIEYNDLIKFIEYEKHKYLILKI